MQAKSLEQWPSDGIVVTLGRGGLATSGAADRWWYRAGERQHHVLDPRTEQPAHVWSGDDDSHSEATSQDEVLIASATAFAPTAAQEEVAAKVALLRGYPTALHLVEAAWETWKQDSASAMATARQTVPSYGDAGVALLLMLDNGEGACSANRQDYLATLGGGGNLWLT